MRKNALSISLIVLYFAAATTAWGRDLGHDEALKLHRQGTILSSQLFWQRALERYPQARLLELELEHKRGRYIYEVELLTAQGQVRELKFDASSGELLKDEEDD